MKKKLLITALIATMVLSMTACGGKEDATPSNTSTNESQTQKQEQTPTSSEEIKVDKSETVNEEEVGKWAKLAVAVPGDTKGVYININYPIGYAVDDSGNSSYGIKGYGDEEICAVLTGQNTFDEVTIESADSILIAYEESVISYLSESHGSSCKELDIDVTGTEMVEINGREMCRYEGKLTYIKNDYDAGTKTPMEEVLVGYSASAANGAYVVWVVVGFEEYADEVAADAETIAKTFRDVE